YVPDNPILDAAICRPSRRDALPISLATTASASSGVGSYPISVTLGTNPNYDVTSTDGTLSVTKKAASVTANNKSKIYGEDNPVHIATAHVRAPVTLRTHILSTAAST